jgi:5-methyltetrahydrofolate--homocysteine methyltransferase
MTRMASLSPDVNDPGFRSLTFQQAEAAYYEQIRGLMDGGVDMTDVVVVLAVAGGLTAVFMPLTTRLYRKA